MEFYKYQGTGNDFVMIDNRVSKSAFTTEQIANLCNRRFGIGADGLILLENCDDYDFKMIYYNSDGKESSMCGNGGRCIIAFANFLQIIGDSCRFLAIDGPHEGKITNLSISLKMSDVKQIEHGDNYYFMDTGSPHYVILTQNIDKLEIDLEARKIRYNSRFGRLGVNVNFMQVAHGEIKIRTYERGVEGETLSCGTGATACAIVAALEGLSVSEDQVRLATKGGQVMVNFNKTREGEFNNIWLTGPAVKVFKGEWCA